MARVEVEGDQLGLIRRFAGLSWRLPGLIRSLELEGEKQLARVAGRESLGLLEDFMGYLLVRDRFLGVAET